MDRYGLTQSMLAISLLGSFPSTTTDIVAVFRTPGGRTHKLPGSVFAVDTFTGYKDILIIHHTGPFFSQIYIHCQLDDQSSVYKDCGMTHIVEEDVRAELNRRAPEHTHEIEALEFPFFKE
jgi:hypothetical protein